MVELVSTLIALVVFSFIIFSSYSSKNEKYAQRKRAYELKEAHMKKSMDKISAEISQINDEIIKVQARFDERNDLSG